MTKTWNKNHLLSMGFAYLVAAAAGPTIFVSSQIVLERVYPTFRVTTPPKTPESSTLLSCAGLQNDASRLHCYDSMSRK